MNHGQQPREMAFPRSGKKQPGTQSQRRLTPESRASWCLLTMCTAERAAQETHSSGDYGNTSAEADRTSGNCRVKNGTKQEDNWLILFVKWHHLSRIKYPRVQFYTQALSLQSEIQLKVSIYTARKILFLLSFSFSPC